MIKKNVIISLADSNYFELLNELVDSIKRFKQSETTAICILDGGLTDEQKKILAPKLISNKYNKNIIEIEDFGDLTIFKLLRKNVQNYFF